MSPAAAVSGCRKHLFGLVGSMFLIVLFFYQWNTSEERRAERIYQKQEVRKQLLRDTCDRDKAAFPEEKQGWEDLSDRELNNLLVDDDNGFIFCYIPKVACSNWRRVMHVLRRGEPYQDPLSIPQGLVHSIIPLLTSFPRAEMKAKMKHYTKFIFVRDPFVRLISAYRNKFGTVNEPFYQSYARKMMRVYGNRTNLPKTAAEAFSSGLRPSFSNFIQYLVDPTTDKRWYEPHWRQFHRLCHPCAIKYDFVGHQESLEDDAMQLLTLIKLGDTIKFPSFYQNVTTHDFVRGWFRDVPLEDRRTLYNIYQEDFKLFGYSIPEELLNG
ncbi:carbohydrate sulfotransferase 12-like [Notolabrus celidotus]|uniref:carbohydrate sulfotransferase 12-like n=1 Tax=Notolabrus celidotus TaxID=1203425 RepID=UPI0014906D26|nr:carbohydrate sulfotransferase 12-like [Notolabrus celidotus]